MKLVSGYDKMVDLMNIMMTFSKSNSKNAIKAINVPDNNVSAYKNMEKACDCFMKQSNKYAAKLEG